MKLQEIISNHMQHHLAAQRELIATLRDHRKEATADHDKMLERHEKTLEALYKIKGKIGA